MQYIEWFDGQDTLGEFDDETGTWTWFKDSFDKEHWAKIEAMCA